MSLPCLLWREPQVSPRLNHCLDADELKLVFLDCIFSWSWENSIDIIWQARHYMFLLQHRNRCLPHRKCSWTIDTSPKIMVWFGFQIGRVKNFETFLVMCLDDMGGGLVHANCKCHIRCYEVQSLVLHENKAKWHSCCKQAWPLNTLKSLHLSNTPFLRPCTNAAHPFVSARDAEKR